MPIIGVVDPSHKQRKRDGDGPPNWLSPEELLEKALYEEPTWSPYPYEVIAAALREIEDRGDGISATALVSPCPRSLILERKVEYITDLDHLWRAFRGTMVHRVLEFSSRPASIAETRFFTKFLEDDELSCKPDLVTRDTIYDYKNVAQVPRYDYPYASHNQQLQINRYIMNNAAAWEKEGMRNAPLPFDVRTTPFRHLVIAYLDLDGPKQLETLTTIQVPTQPGAKNPSRSRRVSDVWTDDRVLDLIVPKFRMLRAALTDFPKFPKGAEEVWGGEADWRCPGYPHCPLRGKCLASRYPNGLVW